MRHRVFVYQAVYHSNSYPGHRGIEVVKPTQRSLDLAMAESLVRLGKPGLTRTWRGWR